MLISKILDGVVKEKETQKIPLSEGFIEKQVYKINVGKRTIELAVETNDLEVGEKIQVKRGIFSSTVKTENGNEYSAYNPLLFYSVF